MFISKINGVKSNIGFKSMNNVVNNVGETVKQLNFPYNPDNETCEVHILRVKKLDNLNYTVEKTPIAVIPLMPNGVAVSIPQITNLDKDADFAIQVVKKDKDGNVTWRGADTGTKMYEIGNGEYGFRKHLERAWKEKSFQPVDDSGNPITTADNKFSYKSSDLSGPEYDRWEYTLVTQNGTTPLISGAGYLVMPDTFMPGWKRREFNEENTGELYFDADYQKKMERMVTTTSNMHGGNLAGLEAALPQLHNIGIKKLYTTPVANGDNRTSAGYYSKNNMHVQENMGTSEDFDTLMMKELQYGIDHVFDITLTSEGLEGIHVNYARRWGEQAQTSRWYRMDGLKDAGVSYGVIPSEAKNLRHRIINSPYKYELQSNGTYKKTVNDDYNPKSETFLQIYDASQVTEEQVKKLDREIDGYRELNAGRNLDINTSDETIISYVFEINPNEYDKNVNKINELVKDGKKLELNSPEGTIIASDMSNFSINKTSEGYIAWDDNPGMIKVNYGVSPYDEKELQSIPDLAERQYERELRIRASKETTDMAVQTGVYWADKTKTAHTIYTIKQIGNIKSAEKINKLIDEGKLPEEFRVTQDIIDNILNGDYKLEPKGQLEKEDVTVKSLMKLPLDSLEFGDNTVGVLSTSYFSNRATTDETIGKTRFELMQQDNPHLIDIYSNVYNKVNNMFTNELKDFAYDVIEKVNETSNTPLLNPDGNYTEYGEYVIDDLGKFIAKYALLKSLSGDSFKYKMYPDGRLTYDYSNIKKSTTLKALGINASNPTEEAEILQKKMLKGLKSLDEKDVEAVAKSISTIIKGTDTNTFRITEGLLNRSGHSLGFRVDALKDNEDMDSVRNRDANIDDTWSNLIAFFKNFVKGVKGVNEHTYIVAEMTDVANVFQDTYGGPDSCPYDGLTNVHGIKFDGEPDAMTKFYNETGITSEAAYSYFFTELLMNFSYEFEKGEGFCDTYDKFKEKYDLLINTRSTDFMRNLYTFIGNHDKTRAIQGLAIDLPLFHSTLMYAGDGFNYNHEQRKEVLRVLSGAKTIEDVPLELRLNVDNLDYFRTISARAVAQSKLLMDSVDEDLDGIATQSEINLIKSGLIDLANGNYMLSKTSEKMTKINISELSSIKNAVNEVARLAKKSGVILSDSDINLIIKKAKQLDLENYLVRGDFGWAEPKEVGEKNKAYLSEILPDYGNSDEYSLYTVQIARLIKDAAKDLTCSEGINSALKEFVKKYNKSKINQNSDEFKKYENPAIARKKNGYAAHDFRTALELAIEQAEFKSGKTISNKENIITTVYNSITEPAIKKQAMLLSFLSAMCGIPTIYTGDEYGDTGYEDKYKNTWVNDRLVSRISEMLNNTKMGKIMKRNKDVTYGAIKNKSDIKLLQNGTSYSMDVLVGGKNREEILSRVYEIDAICKNLTKGSELETKLRKEQSLLKLHLANVAYMMQGADGDMAISIFNAGGIDRRNRVNYYEKYGLHTKEQKEQFFRDNNIRSINPNNPYIPIQEKSELDAILMGAGVSIPIGTVFMNADARDKAKYVVEKIGNTIGIVREGGKKIIMDGMTAENGVMVLKKVKNVAFRGSVRLNNQKYIIGSNLYTKSAEREQGKNLSLIAQ